VGGTIETSVFAFEYIPLCSVENIYLFNPIHHYPALDAARFEYFECKVVVR